MIEDLWYKNVVIYNLDVGTFMDANGDGYGDFEGLMPRLDYLAGLGISCLWLLPFQPDLNIQNPAVQTEIRRIMSYWLELGISGFRKEQSAGCRAEEDTNDSLDSGANSR